jgi:hypothetical protein
VRKLKERADPTCHLHGTTLHSLSFSLISGPDMYGRSFSSDSRDEALEERHRRHWLPADLAACCRGTSYRKPAATTRHRLVESCAKGEEGSEGRATMRSGEAPSRSAGGEEGPEDRPSRRIGEAPPQICWEVEPRPHAAGATTKRGRVGCRSL